VSFVLVIVLFTDDSHPFDPVSLRVFALAGGGRDAATSLARRLPALR
jgi:hypothetical protein